MPKKTKIISGFDFETGKWNIDWPERVTRHNLVYETPPSDPMEGFAIGNGELGALIWFENSKIIIVLNKSDLWDEIGEGRFTNWKASEEDKSTTLRHGCRIIIDFQLPVFEAIYLNDFKGVLDISEGSLNVNTKTPFGELRFSAFICCDEDILACRLEPDFVDNITYNAKIERFGSRTFSHWYYLINRDASIGLGGTDSYFEENFIGIEQQLQGGSFNAGVSIPFEQEPVCPNSYTANVPLKQDSGNIDFFASITSPSQEDTAEQLRKLLKSASDTGFAGLLLSSVTHWKDFWQRSFVWLENDYLDNLWHLNMYYMRCCQGGRYPGRFINGLWGWYHDSQPWNFYFHWNQQCLNWPVNAAGHDDLLGSYFEYRFNSLPLAREDAARLHGKKGAFVSDVTDKDGRNSVGEIHNYTPVAQIAVEFWKQYQYTLTAEDSAGVC